MAKRWAGEKWEMTSRTAAKINSGFLVTKDDMASVKTEMAGIKSEFKLMIWMLVPQGLCTRTA